MNQISKIDQAIALLEKFNATSGDAASTSDNPKAIDISAFRRGLTELGGVSDDLLKHVTAEDLAAAPISLPRLLARQVAEIFKKTDSQQSHFVSERMAGQMTYQQLLDRYTPDEDNAVSKKLSELSKGHAFIVFTAEGKVNADESARLLSEVRKMGPVRDNFTVIEGKPVRLYKVGEALDEFIAENPLFPGHALRPGETCEFTRLSWKDIAEDDRKVIYLALRETKELTGVDTQKAFDIIENLQSKPGYASTRFPKALLLLQERKQTGTEPRLKVKPASRTTRRDDPFRSAAQ